MAQVTRAAHASSVATKLADNGAGDISAQDMREVITDLEDSAMWYDEAPTLTDLASTASGEGASLIGIEDAGDLITAVDAEGALAEHAILHDGYGDAAELDQADVVLQGSETVTIFDAGGTHTTSRPAHSPTATVIWFNHGSQLPDELGTYDIAVGGGAGIAAVNTQTGTSYTLVLGDAGSNVDMDNAGPNTLTIPANASVAFSVGACIAVTMLGAGTTTIEGAAGVSVNGTSAGSVVINNQYSGAVLRKTATDAWVVQGDVT